MKITSAKSESTDAGSPRMFFVGEPGSCLCIQVKRSSIDAQVGIRLINFQCGRQNFVINGECRLDDAGGSCSGLCMAYHGFDGTYCTPSSIFVGLAEDLL